MDQQSQAIEAYQWRQGKKKALQSRVTLSNNERKEILSKRVQMFVGDRDHGALPKSEGFLALLSSALETAQEDCECSGPACAWIETEDACFSVMAPTKTDDGYVAALTASGINVSDFRSFGLQRREALSKTVNRSEPSIEPTETTELGYIAKGQALVEAQVPESVKQKVEAEAKSQGVTISEFIRSILTERYSD